MKTIKDKGFLILSTLVCLLPIVMYLFVFDQLPEQMIQHWGPGNRPTWTMPREFAIWVLPLFLAVIHVVVVIFALNSESSRRATPAKMRVLLAWFVPILSVFVNITVLLANLDTTFNVGLVVSAFVGLTFIIMGNYLPTTRQNYFIGIRTIWTLRSADVWARTHRLGGKLFVLGGILFLLGAAFPMNEEHLLIFIFTIVGIVAVIPIVYSYVISRKG